ncbi:MAG: hypothetical protein K0R61_2168, partial [Microvirga sp.]|nr:hypothetical protein [Microvirga sp.]
PDAVAALMAAILISMSDTAGPSSPAVSVYRPRNPVRTFKSSVKEARIIHETRDVGPAGEVRLPSRDRDDLGSRP